MHEERVQLKEQFVNLHLRYFFYQRIVLMDDKYKTFNVIGSAASDFFKYTFIL